MQNPNPHGAMELGKQSKPTSVISTGLAHVQNRNYINNNEGIQ
jgi:hypothetical protein